MGRIVSHWRQEPDFCAGHRSGPLARRSAPLTDDVDFREQVRPEQQERERSLRGVDDM